MLILTRKKGESINIGDGIVITVIEVRDNQGADRDRCTTGSSSAQKRDISADQANSAGQNS